MPRLALCNMKNYAGLPRVYVMYNLSVGSDATEAYH